MGDCVIRVRIDLIIRLIDTTTGASIDESNSEFIKDGSIQKPIYKGDGNFVFVNTGRENGLMHIKVYGYEETDIPIDYEKLSEVSPQRDVFLIPSESTAKGEPIISISGNLPSLKSIDAINLMCPICSFSEFNAKRKEMTVFGYVAGKNVKLSDTYYGMAKLDEKSYENFVVADQSGNNKVILKEPLQEGTKPNQKIYRLLFGYVNDDGRFSFSVRDDATEIKYLLRIEVGEDIYFRIVDFHETYGEIDLLDGAEKLVVEIPEEEKSEEKKETEKAAEVKS